MPTAEALPAALVTREQWVAWRPQERDGKQTKVPISPATGNFASATAPETWTDFATARDYAEGRAGGLGFVFTEDDPVVGVDLDDCRNPDDGSLADWARDIVDRLNSFTEVSPSGTGVHVLVAGSLPEGRNRHGDVELYDDARFFTMTGDRLPDTPSGLESRQDALEAVHAEYVAADDGADSSAQNSSTATTDSTQAATGLSDTAAASGPGNELGDAELLSRAKGASNGWKFERLYAGDMSGYPSQSEADMALCSLLAFWTGGDPDQLDRLFRDSDLMRPKWDEQHFADGATYGERTIERAIAGTDEFFQAAASAPTDRLSSTGASSAEGDGDTDSGDAEPATDQAKVPVSVVRELEAELERVQAEKEALEAELAAERNRGDGQESDAGDSESSSGWLARVAPW